MSMTEEWQDCGLPLYAYKVTKLPRGTEETYREFSCVYKHRTKGYKKQVSEEKLRQEAQEELAKKEAKLMTEKIDIYPEVD